MNTQYKVVLWSCPWLVWEVIGSCAVFAPERHMLTLSLLIHSKVPRVYGLILST